MLRLQFVGRLASLGWVGTLLMVSGCEQLPGTSKQQGAAIGGLGGAATGAVVAGEHHRVLGALLGGALGAGGGYLIGAHSDRISQHDRSGAEQAVRNAQEHPATPQMVQTAATADLNNDGFVTMDEVVAMRQAGLGDAQMLERLRATGQVFELTPQQQDYLRANGVNPVFDRSNAPSQPRASRAAADPGPAARRRGDQPASDPSATTGPVARAQIDK